MIFPILKNTTQKIMIVWLVLICTAYTNGQNKKIDSLDSLINIAQTDTGRIKLMLQKLDILSTINLDTAITLALKTLKEAQKINFYRGEIDSRKKLVYNYSYKGKFNEAADQIEYLKSFILARDDSADFADLYASSGLLYGMESKYDSSIIFYKKAIAIYERNGNSDRLTGSYSNIAIGFQQKSKFSQALFYQQKSLELYQKINNEAGQAYAYVNMANTFRSIGYIERSEIAFLKSIEIAKKHKMNNIELYAYSNLSSLYMDEAKWEKSYEFAIKAAELGFKMGDRGIQAASLSKAATALTSLGEAGNAIALSKKAIAIADSSSQPLIISQSYSSMGFALKAMHKWQEAIPYYEKSFESTRDADLYTADNGRLYKELSECYEKTGNYSKALNSYRQYSIIADSVRSRDNIKKATELTLNYEFEKKEQAARAKQAVKDEISRSRQLALIIGLFFSIILILGASVGYYNKRKANTLLSKQKDEIEEQGEIIKRDNERKTKELEEARELQLSMLPKDLPNLPDFEIAVHMETATEVGGDYYDFHVGKDNTLTAVIGDATGHGLKAGTIVSITKSLFNSLAAESNMFDTFSKISKVIKEMKFRQLTMCLMMLKIKNYQLSLSSAAMPPALIYRKSDRAVEEIVMKGMPLGAMNNFPYQREETKLNTGDTIFLYSDGLPELANGNNEMYSFDRVIKEFNSIGEKSPDEIVEHFKNAASDWKNGEAPDDDVTFVVIKIK